MLVSLRLYLEIWDLRVLILPRAVNIGQISPLDEVLVAAVLERLLADHVMDLEPLGPDAVSEEAFLKMEGILVLLCVMFETLAGRFVVAILIKTWRFVHVVLAEVHPISLRVEHIYLDLFDPAEK